MRRSLIPGRSGRPTLELATLVVRYPADRGAVHLRGDTPPLDWYVDTPPTTVDGDLHVFRIPVPNRTVEVKPIRADGRWAFGRNLVLSAGDSVEIAPAFEHEAGRLAPWRDVPIEGEEPIRIRYFFPPGYDEHASVRYPVLYCLDGQALFGDATDPYGIWSLDRSLDELWALGVVDELIVVAVETSAGRLDKLGPIADPTHGGGSAARFLDRLVSTIVPLVDAELRTIAVPSQRAILGASMGGLFSFYAAWTEARVFGAAICLSSSFWWADRWMIHEVERTACPDPRPLVYLDSGATASPFAEDANLRDGQHHTRAMLRALVGHCYELGDDLHVLAFPGQHHAAPVWGGRVAVPLQLLFPKVG